MATARGTSMSVPAGTPVGRPTSNVPPTRTSVSSAPTRTGCPSASTSTRRNSCCWFAALHGTSSLSASAIGGTPGPVTDQPPPRTYSLPLTSCAASASIMVTRMGSPYARARQRPAEDQEHPAMTIEGVIGALFIGLIIGALGRLVVPGRQRIPIWMTIAVGIVAALIGSAIVGPMRDTDGVDWIEFVVQVALAAAGVAIAASIRGNR